MPISSPKTTLVLAVTAALGLGAAAASFARMEAAPAAPAPTMVASVNVRQVMRLVKEAEALQADLKGRVADAEKDLAKRSETLKAIQEKMKVMTAGSPEFTAAEEELAQGALQLRPYQEFQKAKIERLSNLAELSLYRKVCARAAKLAESRGCDLLVDMTFSPEDLEKVQPSKAAVDRFIGGDRTLLFARKSVDLTDDLVAVMNNEFNQRGGAPAAAPAAPKTVGPTIPLAPANQPK